MKPETTILFTTRCASSQYVYVFESSGVAYIDVFHSYTYRLAFSFNWHRPVVEQGSSSGEHFNLCCKMSSSAPHWQTVFVAESLKPNFLCSVLVLATPVRRRLRHRHIVHPKLDPGGSFSSGVMFKRVLCGSALSFRFHAPSLQVEFFPLGVLHSVESFFLISIRMGQAGGWTTYDGGHRPALSVLDCLQLLFESRVERRQRADGDYQRLLASGIQ